jgi:hypothetical protein
MKHEARKCTADFDDLIKCHDICIFLESKIDDLDILNLPNGYKSFSKCRQKFCKKSGAFLLLACPKLQVLDSAHFSVEKHRVQWVEDSTGFH